MEDVPAVSSVPVLAVSTGDIPGVVSSPELEPLEPSGPGLRAPAGMAPGLIEPEADPEPTSPCAASTPCAVREEPPTILQFTPRLVAEQLTLMCAELFTKLTYSEWKANLWHQAPTRTIEHLAPTIHQIRQSGATANVVTSSCLGAPSMTDRDRARVVEFWIWVAKVSHGTAPGVHPGILGPAPLLGLLSGWVPGAAYTVSGPLLPGECGPGPTGPRGRGAGTVIPGPFLGLSYSPPPRRAAQQVPGVLRSLGVCLLKDRNSWGDRSREAGHALSSVFPPRSVWPSGTLLPYMPFSWPCSALLFVVWRAPGDMCPGG
ncbi:uncharacterized protein [Manis javanica]|uniref:uncharacterized protein isoform X1 n=1 Tax=Manis javanica TaxID=9974 RepID=UPI003C6DA9D2